jgi:hypothetical protein
MTKHKPPLAARTLIGMRAHRLKLRSVALWLLALNLCLLVLRVAVEQYALYGGG